MTNIVAVIDIETLGLRDSALVLSVGIVLVDLDGTESFDDLINQGCEFYLNTLLQKRNKRTVDLTCIEFWKRQPSETNYVLDIPKEQQIHPSDLLNKIISHFENVDVTELLWFARGPVFDIGILNNLLNQFKTEYPWHYSNIRCVKTLIDFTGQIRNIEVEGYVKHKAIHDAAKDALLIRYNYQLSTFNSENPKDGQSTQKD